LDNRRYHVQGKGERQTVISREVDQNGRKSIGVDPKQISRIEGGKSAPSLDTLEAIATHLQVRMKDLFDFQHLVLEEKIEDQALRLLGLMDEERKKMALRILSALAS